MAQKTAFSYHNIQLYKDQSLGSGAYGGVCKAKCDGLLCAAKIMHSTLFDPHDPGRTSYRQKFQEECRLLSFARHPNVVQYLATYCDPDTQLPILLMELCDESLTAFLERSADSLPYYVQLNICHNIALALVYLHSNGLIHRDLTGNNVLMIAGIRAKITDFGMSRLATGDPRKTLTLCPGNRFYMSPEALDDSPTYTDKLDIFSFGVLVIQIVTRKFPDPTDRFRTVRVPQFKELLRRAVPETERRQEHLKLIPDTNSLKALVLECLKEEEKRPVAVDISARLSVLKQLPQYNEDKQQQVKSSSDIQKLEDRLRTKFESEMKKVVEEKERELQKVQDLLNNSEQLVAEFQHSLHEKEVAINDLQKTISAYAMQIQELTKDAASRRKHETNSTITMPQTAVAVAMSEKVWKLRRNAPERMTSGAAVVQGKTAYFRPADSRKVYAYTEKRWSQLTENIYSAFGLAVVDGLLTSVGGCLGSVHTNVLLSLTGEEEKVWLEVFPPMQTPRKSAASVTTEQVLVVAGGYSGGCINTVEVMYVPSKQWSTVSPLPQMLTGLSGTVCGDSLYLAGGNTKGYVPSRSVFSCSIADLLPTNKLGLKLFRSLSRSQNVWRSIKELSVTHSTLTTIGDHLLAIGGDNVSRSTTDVYGYDALTNSWDIVSQLNIRRSWCFAVTLPEKCLVVVGGYSGLLTNKSNTVEILK